MPQLIDEEFGEIILRRSAKSTSIRLRVSPDGRLRASMPLYAPIFMVKRLIRTSRRELRDIVRQSSAGMNYHDGMRIGKSHSLTLRATSSPQPTSSRHGQRLVVNVPDHMTSRDPIVTQEIRAIVKKALRIEAKSYLPKRIGYLAKQHGFSYQAIRFSHASSRWGSCSSGGTISLNIALMNLPFELIDYVLVHELSHTKEMNHSPHFWRHVERGDPNYQQHRQLLKNQSPSI